MAWFTDEDLQDLAGERSYERGQDYVDVVSGVGDLPDGVVAEVNGTGRYRVRLTGSRDGVIDGECSCPYGREGNFCKHCVAVGLHLLSRTDPAAPRRSHNDIKHFLSTMDHAQLVELVWQHASEDAVLYRRLRLLAATATDAPDLEELGSQVERLRVDWVEYGDEQEYADSAEDLLDVLDRLVSTQAVDVQPLLRRAVLHVGGAAGASEDASGTIADLADRAWETYLRACEAAPPDPAELARWYVDLQLHGPGWPQTSLDDVAGLLGEAGVAAYHQRLAEVAATHPHHWRLRGIREELVAATGDVDAMVAFLAEDVSRVHQFVRIAQLLRAERRHAEAIEWLERGAATAEGIQDQQLVDLLGQLYTEAGRNIDVVALRERYFAANPSERTYQALRAAALDTPQWPGVRTRALDLLRRRAAGDELAAVLLDEGEVEEAWRVATARACTHRVRLAVTARRAETHPAEAVAVYRPLVDEAVAETNNDGYRRAAHLLTLMRPLCARTGDDFTGYVSALKETHRRKRNFLAELSRHNL